MSVSAPMTLHGFKRYLAGLPKALNGAVVRGIQTGVVRSIAIAVAATDAAPPASQNGGTGAVDTGNYRRSWRATNLSDGAVLGNAAGYSPIIEDGRRAGAKMPPKQVAIDIARRKMGLSQREAELAWFPIARAIARRGLRPRHVLTNAIPELVRVGLEEVKGAVAAALRGTV